MRKDSTKRVSGTISYFHLGMVVNEFSARMLMFINEIKHLTIQHTGGIRKPSVANLSSDETQLSCFILIAKPDDGIVKDHAEYLANNRQKLRQYVANYVIQKPAGELTGPPKLRTDKTAFEYMPDGSRYYLASNYKAAIGPYQKALDLEKKERKLERKLWIVLIDNLGMAYGISGDIKASQATFEYGISKEPTYPLFYYNMACGYGELGDETNAIKWLRLAFERKAHMLEGQQLPDPETDGSFAKFRNSSKFKAAISEMKR